MNQLPVGGGAAKRTYVREMFTAIAPTYDRLNRIISFRMDLAWRRRAVRRLGWERVPAGRYLDLCGGTLDFAAILAREPGFRGRIVGADFVTRMLALGRGKAAGLAPVTADALQLPFPDATFDGAMVGWGLRNLIDLEAGLREAARVLKPGARLVTLDTCHPPHQPFRGLYNFYFERVLPRVGRFFSKHTTAYTWLPESAKSYPEPAELAAMMRRAGFATAEHELLLGGATALHVAEM